MKRKDKAIYRVTLGILRGVARLPLTMLYPVSDFVAWVLGSVVGYRKKVVVENLRRCFPEAGDKQIKAWTKAFYRHFCDTFIEAVKLLDISDKEVDHRIKTENAEIVDKAVQEGHSVVLFLGHYGNWEWVPAIVHSFRNDALMGQIYHPLSNKVFDKLMLTIRSRFGSESITMANTYRRLVQIERDGGRFVVGFISDQRPRGHHTDNWMKFMGIDTDYITGGETIGSRLGCRFIYLDVEPVGRGEYIMRFKEVEPKADGKEFPYTRRYMELLEETIRRNPPYWLWSHKRFSHRHKSEC